MSTLIGSVALVAGQQSYPIVFPTPFAAAPTNIALTVAIPNTSGEMFFANYDFSTLTAYGVTLILSGVPTSASAGGYINYVVTAGTSSAAATSTQLGAITVPQLFHRIARHGRTRDFTKLSMSEWTDVAEAANTGLQQVYDLLPIYFKEKPEGFVLRGPAAITGVAVTQYSKTVSTDTFTPAQFGATVRLDGDDQWNTVVGTDELLNPYMGATGTVAGTVYGDSIFSSIYPLDRIIGNPRFPNQGGYPVGPLAQLQSFGQSGWLYQQTIGTPRTWWVQTFGNSQGQAPFVVLKFAPLPDTDYPVSVRIGFWPKRLTLADYQGGSTIVVPPQFLETALIPLCVKALMATPTWEDRGEADTREVFQRAIDAEAFLRRQPGQIGAPANRVFTPIGY